jgi:hypothetical protein
VKATCGAASQTLRRKAFTPLQSECPGRPPRASACRAPPGFRGRT